MDFLNFLFDNAIAYYAKTVFPADVGALTKTLFP